MLGGIFTGKCIQKKDDTFKGDTAYVTTENLALSNNFKATDGNNSTVFRGNSKKDTVLNIDLGKEKEFNTVVLIEDRLNKKSFSILNQPLKTK